MEQTFDALSQCARFHGRTLSDPAHGVVWFNWSCAGFTVRFRGARLRARLRAQADQMTAPFQQEPQLLYPVVAARADGGTDFILREKLTAEEAWYTLFEGPAGEHTVTVIKLSENVMGKAGVAALETDGVFLPPPAEKALRIEVVGDSITCGYGNESSQPGFRTEDENGAAAYGALAAQALDAAYSAVSVSGCSVADPVWLPGMENRGMETLYAYTDAPLQRAQGVTAPDRWDFIAHPSSAVVVNLGTNDANEVKMLGFSEESVSRFHQRYDALLTQIRALNGPDAWILCTLGSMDYYLWDDIRDIVDAYVARTGDQRILCRKLGAIIPFTEGTGADTHPSAATHARMGKELAAILKPYLA